MAEGIAFGLAANLLAKVVSRAFQEIGLWYGVKDELKKLENTLTSINAVLADAEEKQEKSHAVRIWIKRLEQVVYDADDMLDKFAYQDLRRRLDKRMAREKLLEPLHHPATLSTNNLGGKFCASPEIWEFCASQNDKDK